MKYTLRYRPGYRTRHDEIEPSLHLVRATGDSPEHVLQSMYLLVTDDNEARFLWEQGDLTIEVNEDRVWGRIWSEVLSV